MTPNELQELAKEIACFMGWDWTYQPPENENHQHYALIAGPDGCAVHVRNSSDNGKLRISGEWPENLNTFQGNHCSFYPYRDRPNIGVSASRGPQAIAKDILRRFVPGYLPKWYEQVAHRKTTLARMEKERQAICDIADVMGKPSPLPLDEPLEPTNGNSRRREASIQLCPFQSDDWWGSAKISAYSGDPQAHIEIRNVPMDKALQIAAILAA